LAQTAAGVTEALDKLGGTAVFEAKLDGARVQIHRDGNRVTVLFPSGRIPPAISEQMRAEDFVPEEE